MPSFISSFKARLRPPRVFFAEPPEPTPRDYERPIPKLPWRGITVVVVLIVMAAATGWESYCRALGYRPTLNDNEDLWALARRKVKPESMVIIGDSRAWFDLDLDELQKGLGKRPVQLAIAGSSCYPVLADLVQDESFHGTIICSIVANLFFAPPASPPIERSEKAVRRFHTQTPAQKASEYLAMPLEEHVAFLDELDNPVHPRAMESQQERWLHRDTSTRGLSQIRAVNYSLLVHSAKGPRLVDRSREGH